MNSPNRKPATQTAAPSDGEFVRPSEAAVIEAAQKLINEKTALPPRIQTYLDSIKPGLKMLVAKKFTVKAIHEKYLRLFGWKISAGHLRTYLESELDYTPPAPKARTKKTAKKVAKKAMRKG